MIKKVLINLAKFGIVAAIFYYLIDSGQLDFKKLFLLWESPWILAGLLTVEIVWIVPLLACRWWFLLRGIGLNVTIFRTTLLTWIGNFFNVALPGAVSGDLVKGYYIIRSQEKEGKTAAFTTLIIDRFIGLFGLIIMAFVALIFNYKWILSQAMLIPIALTISGLFVGTLIFYAIVLFPFKEGKDPFIRLFEKLPGSKVTVKVYKAFKGYQHHKRTLAITLVLAILLHCTVALMFFQVALLLGITNLDIATQFFIMPLGLITIAIPLAPGGFGVGHAAFKEFYELVGVSGGADIFNLFFFIQLSVFLLGAIPYFLYGNKFRVPKDYEVEE